MSLSGRGRCFITVGTVSVLAGLLLGVTDLERVGVLLLALPVAAWMVVRQARSGLTVVHSVHPSRVEVGDPVEVTLTLSNPHTLGSGGLQITETVPGGVPLRFSIASVRGHQHRTVHYPLPALVRGRFRLGPTTIVATDPFGLVQATSSSADRTELLIRPRPQELPGGRLPMTWRDGSANLSNGIGSGGSDDASVREYRHGDDLRKIHWRSTARTGSIMVRQEERPWQGETLLLLDTRAGVYPGPVQGVASNPDTAPAFEWAVSAMASIAVHLAGRRRRVTSILGDGKVAHDRSGSVLDLLADAQPSRSADLALLATAIRSSGRVATVFAVIAGVDRGPMTEFADAARYAGTAVALLLDADDWRKTDRTDVGLETEPSAGWQKVANMMRSAGWRVVRVTADDDLVRLWPAVARVDVLIR